MRPVGSVHTSINSRTNLRARIGGLRRQSRTLQASFQMKEYKRIWGSYQSDQNNTEYRYGGRYTSDRPSNWEAKIWPSNDPCQNMFNDYSVTLSGPLVDVAADGDSLRAMVGLAVEQA